MFKKEFDIVLRATTPVNETMKKLQEVGIPVNKSRIEWIYDTRTNVPVDSCLIFTGKAFIPRMIPKFTKNGFEHLVLEGRHTFM